MSLKIVKKGKSSVSKREPSSRLAKPKSVQELVKSINRFTGQSLPNSRDNLRGRSLSQSLQVTFLLDTTGSMYPYFKRAKESIARIIKEVAEKHRSLEFSYVAYKNHGDEERFFDGQHPFFATPFTNRPKVIKEEMEKVRNGGGGDGLTALEDVFHYLNTQIRWSHQTIKVVVLVGDMPPHGVLDSVSRCPHEYDYKEEVEELIKKGIKVYSVFCYEEDYLSSRKQKVRGFFKWVAKESGGRYLELADIDDLIDLLVGICMKETGHLDEFITDLRSRGCLKPGSRKERAFLALTDGREKQVRGILTK